VNEPVDLVALHRRIAVQSRRRTAVKVGLTGAGVAAVVGGLFVIRDERSGPTGEGLAAASSIASTATQPTTTALPDCAVVLAGMQAANPTEAAIAAKDAVAAKDLSADTSSRESDLPEANFKGIVPILTIDGSQITFSPVDPKDSPPTSGVAIIDGDTRWMDGSTQLGVEPTIEVGQQVGLATAADSSGVDRAIFIDISTVEDKDAESKPDKSIDLPGPSLPPGPTGKARGTVIASDATSVTVTIADTSGQDTTITIDLAGTPFYAGDTTCDPGALAVGTVLGVAYHLGSDGAVVTDAAMVLPA